MDSMSSFLMGVHELWTSKLAYVGVPAILRVTCALEPVID